MEGRNTSLEFKYKSSELNIIMENTNTEKVSIFDIEILYELIMTLLLNGGGITELAFALTDKSSFTPCVKISRRFLFRRNSYPAHVMFFRCWRWKNLHSADDLESISGCMYGYSANHQSVCINPYHYLNRGYDTLEIDMPSYFWMGRYRQVIPPKNLSNFYILKFSPRVNPTPLMDIPFEPDPEDKYGSTGIYAMQRALILSEFGLKSRFDVDSWSSLSLSVSPSVHNVENVENPSKKPYPLSSKILPDSPFYSVDDYLDDGKNDHLDPEYVDD